MDRIDEDGEYHAEPSTLNPQSPIGSCPVMLASWKPARRAKLANVLREALTKSPWTLPTASDDEFWRAAAKAVAPPPLGSPERTTLILDPCDASIDAAALAQEVHSVAQTLSGESLMAAITAYEQAGASSTSRKRSAPLSSSPPPAKRAVAAPSTPPESVMKRSQSATGLAHLTNSSSCGSLVGLSELAARNQRNAPMA